MSTALQTETHPAHGEHEHAPHVAHHFDTPVQQYEAAVQGMWLFLGTEVLLFSGLFCAYAVYRSLHPEIFEYAHQFLSVKWGAVNTVVLLVSSFTMAAGVWAAQGGLNRLCGILLALTVGCGFLFLGIKYIEYEHKWKEGLLWGKHYHPQVHGHGTPGHATAEHAAPAAAPAPQPPDGSEKAGPGGTGPSGPSSAVVADAKQGGSADQKPAAAATSDGAADQPSWAFTPAASGPRGLLRPGDGAVGAPAEHPEVRNVHMFFAVYFAMTGLHGLHVIAGMIVISWVMVRAFLGHFSPAYSTPVHMVGLYWHVVDLIWIYLFPLLYLIH